MDEPAIAILAGVLIGVVWSLSWFSFAGSPHLSREFRHKLRSVSRHPAMWHRAQITGGNLESIVEGFPHKHNDVLV